MVAIVTGNTLGFARSSAATLGGPGQLGGAQMGRGNDRVYVNAATGNLVIGRTDEVLTGVGPDEAFGLTYNSQDGGTLASGPSAWNIGTYHRITNVTGVVNTAGSTVTRIDGDGSASLFTYDAAKGCYVSQDGPGAANELRFSNAAWTWTDGQSRGSERYESIGGAWLITSAADADGNTQTYTYNGAQLTRITEANGDYTSINWTGGRPDSVTTSYTNASGWHSLTRVHYVFDNLYRLVTATTDLSPEDNSIATGSVYTTSYGYDGNSLRVSSITQSDGSHLDIGYTQSGSTWYVTSLTETVASGVTRVTGLYYDVPARVTTITDPLGGVTTMTYDAGGNLTRLVRPAPTAGAAAPATDFQYNANGDVTLVTQNGVSTAYTYDANGNLTRAHDGAGDTVTRTYTANQLVTETHWLVPDPAGSGAAAAVPATVRYAYDAEGHLRFTVSATGGVTEYRYNVQGQLTSTIVYGGGAYNVAGIAPDTPISEADLQNWVASTDKSNAERTDVAYDFRGNVQTVTRYDTLNGYGDPVAGTGISVDSYVYDPSGQLLSRSNSASPTHAEVFAYDGLGRLISSTDTANATTTTSFDDANSRTTVTYANGSALVSVYDKAGDLLSVTQAGADIATATQTMAYDGLGRVRVETDATQRSTYHVYDADSRKVADVSADGALVEYSYDGRDRLVRKIEYLNKLGTSQIALLSGMSAGGGGGLGRGGVRGPSGANLVQNPSFEQSAGTYTDSGVDRYSSTLPGWAKSNPEFFEQVVSGGYNVLASDGSHWLDLDSSSQVGTAASGANLLSNGGFETSGAFTANGANRDNPTLPNWTAANPQPFQQIASGQYGVTASEGGYWLDLDSRLRTGTARSGSNLLLNGSFESAGVDDQSLPHWAKSNLQPFQRLASGTGGVSAANGAYWLDLDSAIQTGWAGSGSEWLVNGSFENATSDQDLTGWVKTNPEAYQQMPSGTGGVAASSGNYWLDLDSTRQTGTVVTGGNLIANGGFETSGAGYTTTSAGREGTTLPNWTAGNAQPFQQIASGNYGISASEGSFWLDLDSTGQTGWTSSGSNLVGNGSFETAGANPQSMPSWVKANPQVFQQMPSGTGGIVASNGASWLDLDSTYQTGWTGTGTDWLTNGSFESASAQSMTGWVKTNPEDFQQMASGTGGISASNGSYWLDLDSTRQTSTITVGGNLLLNGGFETSGAGYTTTATGREGTTLPNWTAGNPQPFQQIAGGTYGVAASEGSYWLDLDSTYQTGWAPSGSNLVANGSFETAGADPQSMPSWTKSNPQAFQQMPSGTGGIAASNGSAWLDLDSTYQTGWTGTGSNWLTNGSFDQAGANNQTLPGWTKTNSQPYQQMPSGTGGVTASDGANWIDLDSTIQTGVVAVGSDLIQNGSFETSGAGYTTNANGRVNATLPGWTGNNAAGIEQVASGALGVGGATGSYWLDLDSSIVNRVTTGSNLIVNGSFEQTNNSTPITGGRASAAIPGWSKSNPQPFEEMLWSENGVAPSDGSYWLDLDAAATVVPGANLVLNGSFEDATGTPTTTANGQLYTSIPNWTKTSASQGFELLSAGGWGVNPTDGSRFLDMDANGGAGSNIDISQVISTSGITPGTELTLNFDYASSLSGNGLQVFWNGSQIANLGFTSTSFVTKGYQVYASSSGNNTLRFVSTGTADGHGVTLDNVKVFVAQAPTPGSGGNMDITQTIANRTAGEIMQLKFDHALMANATGGVQVLWNGTVIDTITDTSPLMQTSSYYVTAVAGNNVVEFKGTGTVDDRGASIDNVQLYATQLVATPTNLDIQQTVANLSAGQTMQLQFDYANRTTAGSGSFDVLWNGAVVATVSDGTTTMQGKTLLLTAQAGNNVLRFRGTGTADDAGASIDNVRMFATQPVYTPGNMDIKQTVGGLAAGQKMQLTFDYANRTTAASGSFDVLWNGAVVASVTDGTTTMQTRTILVDALGGGDVLEFRGTGTADDVGASLDNVRLLTAAPVYTPGNMDISQTIPNLTAGQKMQLSFDYASRAAVGSGSFDVLWNGVVVATITNGTTTMQNKVLLLDAVAGNNVLRFRGTGTADDIGASLDNVQLYAATPVYTPGNMVISQTVSNLAAGQKMQLTFDYAKRAGTSTANFEVLWNGLVVATVADGTTTMRTASYYVTAQAGDNVVAFRGIGVADDAGASIDNARLYATAPVYTPGNMDIKQTVSGLTAGQKMQLTFDYANRTTAASGSFDVLWNGSVVATVTDGTTTMQTKTLYVDAVGGGDVLEFRGTGTADDVGASLDNVHLFTAAPVYTPGNMDISQSIPNLAAGQKMQLKFDYASRAPAGSGSFEVLWNGAIVATVTDGTTTMQNKTLLLDAVAGNNVLQFRGTGTADDIGASLDNVQLYAATPVYTPGNMVISQTVSNLAAGQKMQLQFDYANRTGTASGTFDVLWNGAVVATVTDGTTTMRGASLYVTAVAGDNVLTFRGTGTADDAGASIDNVRLFATAPVYTPGNMDIKQTVSGLTAGQKMQLTFDYANRTTAASGSFDVLWNGNVVASVSDGTTTMQTRTILVDALGGGDVLEFRGTGTADDIGASIDNVHLLAAQPVYSPGNMDISQTVSNLAAGQAMELQFSYASRAGAGSGTFDVLWNGQVVATVTDGTTAMQTRTLSLVAQGGNNVLGFRGTGTADDVGASLDDVQLYATQPVYSDGNMDISQAVGNLAQGQTVQLQFDYANRTGTASGTFQVLWNGVVIDTVTDGVPTMQGKSYTLTAQAGTNVVGFRGAGAADDQGASLDNVRLFATQPLSAPGNMAISQTIPNLTAGQPLQLQFDHANRTGGASGSLEIWWNGAKIDTITDADATMRTSSYTVYAVGGSNLLEFRGAGAADEAGASLDNVRLFAFSGSAPGASSPTDPLAGLRPVASPDDITSWNVYDAADRVVETIDSAGRAVTFAYDGDSRLVGSTAYANAVPAGTLAGFAYAPPSSIVLPGASAADQPSRTFYDGDGRVIGSLDGAGGFTRIDYDAAGRRIREIAYANPVAAGTRPSGSFADMLASVGSSAADRRDDYVYDDEGQLRFTIDAAARPTEMVYDAAGRVVRTTVYAGSIGVPGGDYSVDYVQGQITGTGLSGNPDNRVTRFVYDQFGRLAYGIDAEGGVSAYAYDNLGQPVNTRAFLAKYGSFADAPSADAMQAWAANNASSAHDRVTRQVYDAAGRVAFVVDAEGFVSETRYDAAGRVQQQIRYPRSETNLGGLTKADVAAAMSAQPAGAVIISYGYDSAGRLTDVTDGENVVTHYALDALGQATDTVVAYGTNQAVTTHRVFDAAGRVKAETVAAGTAVAATTTFDYDALGNLMTETDARGFATTRTYDALGRLTNVTTPIDASTSATTHYDYNSFGEVVRTVDARGNATLAYYDRLGRLTLQLDPEGYVTETTYTDGDQPKTVTRYAGRFSGDLANPPAVANSPGATTRFEYDHLGRLTKVTDAENNYEQYTLDAFANRVQVRNKLGGITDNAFDRRGLLTSETIHIIAVRPGGATETTNIVNTYDYDARGNLKQKVEALGFTEARTTSYTYDKRDRLVQTTRDAVLVTANDLKTQTWVTPTETIDYDLRGNVVRTVDAVGAQTFFYYDAQDRKTASVDALGALSGWTYDANGNVKTARVYADPVPLPAAPGGTPPSSASAYRETTFAYDRANRLTSSTVANVTTGEDVGGVYATATSDVTSSSDYDAAGNVVRSLDGRGNATWSWYDKLGRKVAQVDAEGYLSVWARDAEGNVKAETRYSGKIAGGFDQNSSLAALQGLAGVHPDDRTTTFTYDQNGRRLSETRLGVQVASVAQDGTFTQPTQDVTVSYQYNALGEVTRKTEATGDFIAYDFDNGGRQIRTTSSTFTDFQNNAVARTSENYYDGLGNLKQTVQNGARTTSYTYGKGGRLASMTDAAGFARFYDYDAAGRMVKESWTRTLSGGSPVTEANAVRYDAAGRTVFQAMASWDGANWNFGDQTQYRYDAYGELTGKGLNGLWQETFDYDPAGRLWRSTAGDGTYKFFLADKAGNTTLTVASSGADLSGYTSLSSLLAYLTNYGNNAVGAYALGGVVLTMTSFDKRGQQVQERDPFRELGQGQSASYSTAKTYNAFGEVTSETDARGYTTDYAYNGMGRLVQKQSPSVSWTDDQGTIGSARPTENYFYDVSGRLVATQDANGNYTRRALLAGTGYGGAAASVVKEFHADGGVVETRYDVFGDARTVIDALGHAETRTYDAMDRLLTVVHAQRGDGTQLTDNYGYDGLGQRTRHWNSQFGASTLERTDYDLQGRVVSTVSYAGDVTSTTYAWNGGTGTAGLATFGGWTKTTSEPTGRSAVESTDYFGRLVGKTDLGGHVFSYTFDKGGRATALLNGAGQTLATYAYLNTGLIGAVTMNGVASSYGYDAAGNRTVENDGGQESATVTYDALGRMTHFADSRAGAANYAKTVDYEYDLAGNIRHISVDNGTAQDFWYKYDKMNRYVTTLGTLSNGRGSSIVRGARGYDIQYDLNGNRVKTSQTVTHPTYTGGQYGPVFTGNVSIEFARWYDYWEDGYVKAMSAATGPDATFNAVKPANPGTTYSYDALGRLTTVVQGPATSTPTVTTNTYDMRSQLLSQTTTYNGTTTNSSTYDYNAESYAGSGSYTGAWQGGAITHSHVVQSSGGTTSTTDTKTSYVWWDGAERGVVTVAPGGASAGTSTYSYDAVGHLTSVYIQDSSPRTIAYTNDADGRVLTGNNATYYYLNGKVIGDIGGTPLQTTAGTLYTNFDQSFHTIQLPTAGGNGTYIVQEADTLQSIAAGVWGDSSLWYLLADANGLNGTEALAVGRTLIIPANVTSAHHSASTFAVYDPNTAWGDTLPSSFVSDAPAPTSTSHRGGCGIVGTILLVAVAVAVTVVTSGAFAAAAASATGTSVGLGGGIAMAMGGTASGLSLTAGGMIAAGAIGAAAGSVVSQAVGVATGLQDKFSWKGVAMAALSGGIGGGVGSIGALQGASGITGVLQGAARSAIGSALTQGIGVATGLQNRFDWTGVAAAGVAGGVAVMAGRLFNADSLARNNTISNHLANAGVSMASAIASAATRSLITGSDFGDTMLSALPDVLGATIGNMLALGVSRPPRLAYDPAAFRSDDTLAGGSGPAAPSASGAAASNPIAGEGGGQTVDRARAEVKDIRALLQSMPPEQRKAFEQTLLDGIPVVEGSTPLLPYGKIPGSAASDPSDTAAAGINYYAFIEQDGEDLSGWLYRNKFINGSDNSVAALVDRLSRETAQNTFMLDGNIKALNSTGDAQLMKVAAGLQAEQARRQVISDAALADAGHQFVTGTLQAAEYSPIPVVSGVASIFRVARGEESLKSATINVLGGHAVVGAGKYFLGALPVLRGARTAESLAPEGIVYSRIDLNGEVLPYGGQAKSEARFLERQIEHSRKYPDADFEFQIVATANPGEDLDVAEHLFIQELTGGVKASRSPAVSNLKDPVGRARRLRLGLPEPRSR